MAKQLEDLENRRRTKTKAEVEMEWADASRSGNAYSESGDAVPNVLQVSAQSQDDKQDGSQSPEHKFEDYKGVRQVLDAKQMVADLR